MSSLADPAVRASITARIDTLTPDTVPRWGSMTAPQMLAHCADALRMAYGDLTVAPKRVPLVRLAPVKWLLIYGIPFPKGAPTAKELRSRVPLHWGDERETLRTLVARFGEEASRRSWPEHPLFGPLDGRYWGQLAWKHLDHHLRQFGV
jgi:hypothetical protein